MEAAGAGLGKDSGTGDDTGGDHAFGKGSGGSDRERAGGQGCYEGADSELPRDDDKSGVVRKRFSGPGSHRRPWL